MYAYNIYTYMYENAVKILYFVYYIQKVIKNKQIPFKSLVFHFNSNRTVLVIIYSMFQINYGSCKTNHGF